MVGSALRQLTASWALVALLLVPALPARADLIFGVPPADTQLNGQDIYRPLVDYLARTLGQNITYEVAPNWLSYQRDIREGRFDLAFDGPHLVGWRVMHGDHTPLVRLPSPLRYHVLVRASDNATTSLDSLVGQRVCALAPPDLSALMLYDFYLNPTRQPSLESVAGDFDQVYEAFAQGRCVAMILPEAFVDNRLPGGAQGELRILATTPELPNQALTAGPRLSPQDKDRAARALSQGAEAAQASTLLRAKFDPRAPQLVTTGVGEYAGFNLLLEGAVFGW